MLSKMEYWWNQALVKQGKDPMKMPFKRTMIKILLGSLLIWSVIAGSIRWVIMPAEIPDGMYLQVSQLVRAYPELRPEVLNKLVDGKITMAEYLDIQKTLSKVKPGKPALQQALRSKN